MTMRLMMRALAHFFPPPLFQQDPTHPPHSTDHHHQPTPQATMSLEEGTEFLFTSESVNEGHPGTSTPPTLYHPTHRTKIPFPGGSA